MGMEQALVRALIQESAMGENRRQKMKKSVPDPAEGFIEERPEADLENQQGAAGPGDAGGTAGADGKKRARTCRSGWQPIWKEKRLKLWAGIFGSIRRSSGFDALDQRGERSGGLERRRKRPICFLKPHAEGTASGSFPAKAGARNQDVCRVMRKGTAWIPSREP